MAEAETDKARKMLAEAYLVEQRASEREREVAAAHDECTRERAMVEILAHEAETMKIADHQRKVDDLRRLSAALE